MAVGTPERDAYSLLERSFDGMPHLKAHKSLPRRRLESSALFPSAAPMRMASFTTEEDTASNASSKEKPPLGSPLALNGNGLGLPPTPPSNARDRDRNAGFRPPPFADGVVRSLLSRESLLSTPKNQRSPPTPDTTPPGSQLTIPQRPPHLRQVSSTADSFRTAREDPWSSDEEDIGRSRRGSPALTYLSTSSLRKLRQIQPALGDDIVDRHATPTQQSILDATASWREVSPKTVQEDRDKFDDIPNREWDTNHMRNVTVRRRKRPQRPTTPPRQSSPVPSEPLSPRTKADDKMATQGRPQKLRRSSNLSMDRGVDERGSPSDVNNSVYSSLRDQNRKRFSDLSSSSTTVEAVIVSSPVSRRRTLRHTSKNLSLRSNAASAQDSPRSLSDGASLRSYDAPQHRLTHKRASIPDRRNRDSIGSATSESEVTSASSQDAVGRKDNVTVTVTACPSLSSHEEVPREETQSTTPKPINPRASKKIDRARWEEPEEIPGVSYGYAASSTTEAASSTHSGQGGLGRSINGSDSQSQASSISPSTHHVLGMIAPSQAAPKNGPSSANRFESPPRRSAAPRQRQSLSPPDVRTARRTLHRAQEALAASQERAGSATPKAQPPDDEKQSKSIIDDAAAGAEKAASRSETDPSNRSTKPSSQDKLRPSPNPIPRISLDDPDGTPSEQRRISLDRSTIRIDEHAMARHLYAQETPFSTSSYRSEVSENPEINEATAVNIYPHNNESLVLVQQSGRPSSEPRRIPETIPFLTFEPSTPPQRIAVPALVDSPLKNPRKPPEPPAFKIIPPTPLEELEQSPLGAEATRPIVWGNAKGPDPTRSKSLTQRARRYSDTLIRPLFARTTSLRRSPNRPGSSQQSANSQAEKLHPFWRPRGFWDDYDSDSSDDEWFGDALGHGYGYEPLGDIHLPSGGDTSNVLEDAGRPRPGLVRGLSKGRRLTDGFRGTGGFLIGNSLGVERHPTNGKRHHVSLPINFSLGRRGAPGSASGPTKVEKKSSLGSLRSKGSGSLRAVNRTKRRINSLPLLRSVQYVGPKLLAEKMRNRRQEKRRDQIRQSIGPRFMVEGARVA